MLKYELHAMFKQMIWISNDDGI